MTYATLLSPGRIGALELRNRIVVTAMGINFGEEDGRWSERILAYHEEQARGGAGLVISGACGVMHPVGQVQPWQIAISRDEHVEGHGRKLVACELVAAQERAHLRTVAVRDDDVVATLHERHQLPAHLTRAA